MLLSTTEIELPHHHPIIIIIIIILFMIYEGLCLASSHHKNTIFTNKAVHDFSNGNPSSEW